MAKEKSITELKDKRNQLYKRGKEITDAAKKEIRQLSQDENKELADIQIRMSEINLDIAASEAADKQEGERHQVRGKQFSLRKSILGLVDGVQDEETRQMSEIGRTALTHAGVSERGSRSIYVPVEARDSFTATGAAGTGSDLIETNFMDILKPLRDRLVFAQAGATVMTGLRGNIDIPEYSGSVANWEAENDPAKDGGGEFSHKTMKPKRLTAILTVSRQLLIQDTLAVEQLLRSDLIDAVAGKLEATGLGNHASVATKPDGLFTGLTDAPVAFSWDAVVDLETKTDLANALVGKTGYVMHTALRGKGKTTVKKQQGAVGFILEQDGTMNGYQALRTNAVAGDETDGYGIIFGNWNDLLIGQWGALELMVDPYTKADEAFVRLIVNSYWDIVSRRAKSFSKAYMTV